MSSTYEHIVLGVGGIGSAAACWLARRGSGRVLALERYRLGHDRGAPAVRDPGYPSDFRFSRAAQALPGDSQGSTP